MNRNAPWLAAAFAVTFVLGGAIGYLASDRSSVDGTSTASASHTAAASARAGAISPGEIDFAMGDAGNYSLENATDDALARRILAAARARDYFRRRHDIYEVGQQLNADNIRAAIEATQRFSDSDRESTQYALIARWLELDPAAAYEWVSALPRQGRRSELMREFFHSLGMKDPVAGMSFLAQHKTKAPGDEDFTYSVLEAWSAHDPIAAVDAALATQDKDSRSSALSVALGRWARRDPHAALGRIEHLPENDRRGHVRAILREWAKVDHDAAARHAASLPEERDRHEAQAAIVAAIGGANPEAAMRLAEEIPAGAVRNRALSELIREIGYKEPAIAAQFVLALPPGEQRNAVHQVIHTYARHDPVAAMEFAGGLASHESRSNAVSSVMGIWAAKDPKAAAEFCARSPLATPGAMGTAVSYWAAKNAPEALAWARGLPAGPQRDTALGSAIATIAGTDPQQAVNLVGTMPPGETQGNTYSAIAGAWASKDPVAAADWAAKLSDPSVRMNAVSSVATRWAAQDPAAAAAWAARSAQTAHTLSSITRAWATVDSAAAAKWLDTQPAGNHRDSAIRSFAQVVADADPPAAAAWAATISQPQQRDNLMGDIYRQWKRADPNAADAWLRVAPGLSDEARERMTRWK